MLFQCLCGIQPIFYSTHPNEEPYFYVLFVNLVCGFGYGGISSRGQAIKILCASFFLAAGLPGLIWYQHRRLMKLENLLHDLLEICDKIK